jgi:hypothetical protein
MTRDAMLLWRSALAIFASPSETNDRRHAPGSGSIERCSPSLVGSGPDSQVRSARAPCVHRRPGLDSCRRSFRLAGGATRRSLRGISPSWRGGFGRNICPPIVAARRHLAPTSVAARRHVAPTSVEARRHLAPTSVAERRMWWRRNRRALPPISPTSGAADIADLWCRRYRPRLCRRCRRPLAPPISPRLCRRYRRPLAPPIASAPSLAAHRPGSATDRRVVFVSTLTVRFTTIGAP